MIAKNCLKLTIIFVFILLFFSNILINFANSLSICRNTQSIDNHHPYRENENILEKSSRLDKITVVNAENRASNNSYLANPSNPCWDEFYSDEWYREVIDEEWGKIGKVNQKIVLYKLKYDKAGYYDWYAIVWVIQIVPGAVAYNTGWNTMDIWNEVDGDLYKSYTCLIDYGPYSTQGQTTVTYSIGVEAGENGAVVSASISVSYTVADINVHDESDFSGQLAKWWHDVNEDKVGGYTVTIKPGAVFRVPQAKDLELNFTTAVRFGSGLWYSRQYTARQYWHWSEIWKNYKPDTPSKPSGPDSGDEEKTYTFSTRAIDPDHDEIRYEFSWGDGTRTLTDWFKSDQLAEAAHRWSDSDTHDDTYSIKVIAQDKNGAWSEYSDIHPIYIRDDDKGRVRVLNNLLKELIKRCISAKFYIRYSIN